ncbi:MAG: hypothetical protein KTR14_09395, partial [Vampirovibrio sp.]|nr:hypothetical protein [Vampirovibrio sp.]
MLMFLVLVMLEITILGAIVSRGMGEEGILGSQNIAAQQANQTATRRLSDDLRDYLIAGGDPANVLTDFAEITGANAIVDQNLAAVDPETGTSAAGNVTINAWVAERRNVYYHIITKAEIGQVSLVQHQWVKVLPSCVASSGLSLLLSGAAQPGGYGSLAINADDRVFFNDNDKYFWTWKESTGLSVLASDLSNGSYSMAVSPSGQAFFGGGFNWLHMYDESTGLSLLHSGRGTGTTSMVFSNNNAYIGSGNVGASPLYKWNNTDGLSILYSAGESHLGDDSLVVSDGERLFFGSESADTFYTWHASTGTSIILSGDPEPGDGCTDVHNATSRVYFCSGNGGDKFYTWSTTTDLSVLLSNIPNIGSSSTAVDQNTGRVFVGEYGNTGQSLSTWEPSSGMSVLESGINRPGHASVQVTPSGNVFWGGFVPNFWVWNA